LKVWIGHYMGNPKEWFVVWAENKREAFLQIDSIVAEPDMDSLMELHTPGFVNFTVEYDEENKVVSFLPPKEDVEGGYWLVFEEDEDVEKYVLKIIKKKEK